MEFDAAGGTVVAVDDGPDVVDADGVEVTTADVDGMAVGPDPPEELGLAVGAVSVDGMDVASEPPEVVGPVVGAVAVFDVSSGSLPQATIRDAIAGKTIRNSSFLRMCTVCPFSAKVSRDKERSAYLIFLRWNPVLS